MPTPTSLPERQLVLRHRVAHKATQMRDHARQATAALESQRAATKELEAVTVENPTLAKVSASERIFYIMILLALPATYFIDVVLLGPVAEYLTGKGFEKGSLIGGAFGKWAVPAAIITLEAVISSVRTASYRAYLAGDSSKSIYILLTLGSVALALFIPITGLAVYLASDLTNPETSEIVAPQGLIEQAIVFLPMMLPIVLSLTCHLLILLNSRNMHEAKTWLIVAAKCMSLRDRQERSRQAFDRESVAAADAWPLYLQDCDEYNAAFQPALPVGPFDANTRDVVNGVYGYEVIRVAAAPSGGNPAGSPQTPHAGTESGGPQQPAADDAPADDPDWEDLYARQRQADEAEVRA